MSFEEQNKIRDQYKEIELKYKRYDVLARVIGAFAAIASAIAAFIALRGYTGFSTATPQPSPTAPVVSPASPSVPKASTTTPSKVASPSNLEALQPSPSNPKDDDDRRDDDDD
jgi:hypothetical protein